jgi:hypothetical protein
MAENCSTTPPDVLVALHPVQLVSIIAVPGETVRLALEAPPFTSPPQPARTKSAGNRTHAVTRPGDCRSKNIPLRSTTQFEMRFRCLVITSGFWPNSSGVRPDTSLGATPSFMYTPMRISEPSPPSVLPGEYPGKFTLPKEVHNPAIQTGTVLL